MLNYSYHQKQVVAGKFNRYALFGRLELQLRTVLVQILCFFTFLTPSLLICSTHTYAQDKKCSLQYIPGQTYKCCVSTLINRPTKKPLTFTSVAECSLGKIINLEIYLQRASFTKGSPWSDVSGSKSQKNCMKSPKRCSITGNYNVSNNGIYRTVVVVTVQSTSGRIVTGLTTGYGLAFNKNGDEYPAVMSTRTFDPTLGYTPPFDDYTPSQVARILPLYYDSYRKIGGDFRNSKPHYPCLQLMWRNEIIEFYKRQSWTLPSDKFEAHHIIPLDYSGEAGWGSGITYTEPLPKRPNLKECYAKVKVSKYNLENGVLLAKPDHVKFNKWFEGL
jgi:hypothetical protein